MLGMSWSSCHRYHPAEVEQPCRSAFGCPCCLRRTVVGSAFGALHFRGHLCVHFRYGPMTRSLPRETLSTGFRMLVSRHPAIQATGRLTLTPAGLSPAEHASLHWTHSRSLQKSSTKLHHLFPSNTWILFRAPQLNWRTVVRREPPGALNQGSNMTTPKPSSSWPSHIFS